MTEGLITITNPQPEVRKNAENAKDWVFQEEAQYLYRKAVGLRDRLIDPIARIDRNQVPDPIIGFDNLRNYKVLAEYILTRDAVGLNSRITFNVEHYLVENNKPVWKWGRWAQLETLAHEYVHLLLTGQGVKTAHGKEFTQKCESIGLHPLPGVGSHMKVADEPFSILMKEWGIDRPQDVPYDDRKLDWFKLGKETKGRSSLTKWECPECGLKVRIGIKGDPEIVHDPCSIKKGEKVFFVRADNLAQAMLGKLHNPE
jgi:hypothetical protein